MAKKHHNWELPALLEEYAKSRTLDFQRYSDFHMRIIDVDYTVVDFWTTEKYWIKETNYCNQTKLEIVERQGESGFLPPKPKKLYKFLDELFYAADILEQ